MRKWIQNQSKFVVVALLILGMLNSNFNPIHEFWSRNLFGLILGLLGDLSLIGLLLIGPSFISGWFKGAKNLQARLRPYQLELAMMCLACYFVLPLISLLLSAFGIGQWADSF